jgi:ubiquinone/menaquinone biosynthesis C-methylase UbiE
MRRHRYLLLVVAVIVWATAVGVYFFGRKALWFGAETAAVVLAVHIILVFAAFALGGASLLGFVVQWLHGEPMAIENPGTTGKVIHWAWAYDPVVWILTLGRERAFRERTLELARLAPGESVLDVGCGTGSLAIGAKTRVGATGKVAGIDASPEMIARARRKALRAGSEVGFEIAVVENLPFAGGIFDVVLSTVMLHHLPEEARRKCIAEIGRVLKPGGRFLAVDFGGTAQERHSRAGRLHNHAHFDLRQVIPVLNEAGLSAVETGATGIRDLQFIRAAAPTA